MLTHKQQQQYNAQDIASLFLFFGVISVFLKWEFPGDKSFGGGEGVERKGEGVGHTYEWGNRSSTWS